MSLLNPRLEMQSDIKVKYRRFSLDILLSFFEAKLPKWQPLKDRYRIFFNEYILWSPHVMRALHSLRYYTSGKTSINHVSIFWQIYTSFRFAKKSTLFFSPSPHYIFFSIFNSFKKYKGFVPFSSMTVS